MVQQFSEGVVKLLSDVWDNSSYNTVQALSDTLRKSVKLNESTVVLKNLRGLPDLINPANSNVAVVVIQLKGEFKGTLIISAKDVDMMQFADILLRKPIGYSKNLNEENLSVIGELGNLLGGFYLEGFMELFGKKIKLDKPEIFFNENRVIEHSGLGNVYLQDIKVLLFQASLSINLGAACNVLLIFQEDSLNQIFNAVLQKI